MEIKKNGFKNVRLGIELDVYVIEGKEWFKAKDISDFLGYAEAKDMVRIISFEENIIRHIMPNVINPRGTLFINEFGLYEIVCKINKTDLVRFDKSREFQKWVFSEVLPSIRKANFYVDKDNITKNQIEELKDYLFDLCESGKISLGKASKMLFGNEAELKKRFVNLGWINYDNCTFEQKKFKASNDKEYELFICNMSGTYDEGVTKHQLQVSLTNAGYVWIKHQLENNKDLGKEVLN